MILETRVRSLKGAKFFRVCFSPNTPQIDFSRVSEEGNMPNMHIKIPIMTLYIRTFGVDRNLLSLTVFVGVSSAVSMCRDLTLAAAAANGDKSGR